MKLNKLLLTSSFMALMILPACNWFGNKSETAIVEEEVVVMTPEMESLQNQQIDDENLDRQNLDDLSLLPDSEK